MTTDRSELAEAWLEPLPEKVCLELLRKHRVGRLAVDVDGGPVIVPVNYRLVEGSRGTWIAFRTRPGNVIDRASIYVALEIDSIAPDRQEGWSVLVRGTMHRVDSTAAGFAEQFDPEPWIADERDAWLVIDPFAITGRRLHAPEREWAFQLAAYL